VVAPQYNACQENIPTAKSTFYHQCGSQEEGLGCPVQRRVPPGRRPYPRSLVSEKRRSLLLYKKIILYKKILTYEKHLHILAPLAVKPLQLQIQFVIIHQIAGPDG
jgi:hypothetical protein